MSKDFSNQNLQKASFLNEDLAGANFKNSDLRGADFTGSNLTGARFNEAKIGIVPLHVGLIFFVSLAVSLFSGYIAMLAGTTVQLMLHSSDSKERFVGVLTIIIIVVFIAYFWWKGGTAALRNLVIPIMAAALFVGAVSYLSGAGTGRGMLYLLAGLILVVVMLAVGTMARAAAGTTSSTILFLVVALGGGMFGKSVGGGIGTTIMAISCVQISKRALKGVKGFDTMQKLAIYITTKFGTSFRNANLTDADFSAIKIIRNADFTAADVSYVCWGDSQKINCLTN